MTTRFATLAFLIIGAAGVQASPVFQFTWTSVSVLGEGQGVTFTGEILGLPDNGSGPASDVVLDSITGATPDPGIPFSYLPVDLLGPDFEPAFPLAFTANQFVVQNDVITSALFAAQGSNTAIGSEYFILGQGIQLIELMTGGTIDSAPPDVVSMFATPYSHANYGTATYTLVTPEPSTAALILLGLTTGAIYRKRWN